MSTETTPKKKFTVPATGAVVTVVPNGDKELATNGMKECQASVLQPNGTDYVNLSVLVDNPDKPVVIRRAVRHESMKVDGQCYWK